MRSCCVTEDQKFIFFLFRRTGSPLVRTPSPRRSVHHPHHDIGFSDTVSNVVEIVKEERGARGHRHFAHSRFPRGEYLINVSKIIASVRNKSTY